MRDATAVQLMCMLVLFNDDVPRLKHRQVAVDTKAHYAAMLRRYARRSHHAPHVDRHVFHRYPPAARSHFVLARLMSIMGEARHLASFTPHVFCAVGAETIGPLVIELLGGDARTAA